MTALASKPNPIWHQKPRPQVTTQRVTAQLDAVIDRVPQATPALLAPLAAQSAARAAEFLATESLTGAKGYDVTLVEHGTNRAVAFATVLQAEGSDFQSRTRLDPSVLEKSAFLTRVHVAPDAPKGTSAVLLYAALRQARSWDRKMASFLMVDDATPLARQYNLVSLGGVPRIDGPGGHAYRAKSQRLDIVLHRAFEEAREAGQPVVPSFLVAEILDTINNLFLDKVGQASFFQAVEAGTLTREQYVYSLTQMHQFVRYTTRLLGRCVGTSPTTELRTHFIAHLRGEINHEIIIEKDLAHLGEDVQYVKELAQANLPTREFMCTQEAAIGFYEDPILMLAAPLAAEGVSGHLGNLFMEKLNGCVASWGVKEPQKATHFLGSHIEFDGGDDGHWQGNLDLLAQHLKTEQEMRRFLSMLRVSVDATLKQWDSYVSDVDLFSALPQP
ncbi:hypothetical protein [Hyalangium versicolor]|uniref:hypothetical protein n=1 Tax=Hyalangium versicolor TaxID=2861190 RepID=UPI001CCC8004|nr:hypothetical protein [Hyalangium versicolor]